jgi:hypothetical protein
MRNDNIQAPPHLLSRLQMLHIETRCPMDPDAVDAFYPGDVNKVCIC